MAESPYPSQQQDKFVLRLPDGMRDRIKDAAATNNRSMNAEIVAALEEKYPAPKALNLEAEIASALERAGITDPRDPAAERIVNRITTDWLRNRVFGRPFPTPTDD